MKKEERIKKYGKTAYERKMQQSQEWNKKNQDKIKASNDKTGPEQSRKGGKYYDKKRKHQMTGIPHDKELVRGTHKRRWSPYKQIIAPESQIHHEWIPATSKYHGVALVEKYQHQHGFIDVIQILEGKITLLTEAEIKKGGDGVW